MVFVSLGPIKQGGGSGGRHLRLWASSQPTEQLIEKGLLVCSCPGGLGSRPAPFSCSRRPGPISWTSGTSVLQGGSKKILFPSLNHLVPVPAGVFPQPRGQGGPWQEGKRPFPEGPQGPARSPRLLLTCSLFQTRLPLWDPLVAQEVTHTDQLHLQWLSLQPTAPPSPSQCPMWLRLEMERRSGPWVSREGYHITTAGFSPTTVPACEQAPLQPQGLDTVCFRAQQLQASECPTSWTLAPRAPEKAMSSAPRPTCVCIDQSHAGCNRAASSCSNSAVSAGHGASAALTGLGSPEMVWCPVWAWVLQYRHCSQQYPSQLSSALPPPSYPLTSPSPSLASLSPIVGPGCPFTTRARTSWDTSASVLPAQPQAVSRYFQFSTCLSHLRLQGWLLFSGQSPA